MGKKVGYPTTPNEYEGLRHGEIEVATETEVKGKG